MDLDLDEKNRINLIHTYFDEIKQMRNRDSFSKCGSSYKSRRSMLKSLFYYGLIKKDKGKKYKLTPLGEELYHGELKNRHK
jgi:predicted transcriptional regulator